MTFTLRNSYFGIIGGFLNSQASSQVFEILRLTNTLDINILVNINGKFQVFTIIPRFTLFPFFFF